MIEMLSTPPANLVPFAPDACTAEFWDAAANRRLVVPRCVECLTYRFPPTPVCPRCRSGDTTFDELTGRGSIYTFTIARHAPLPALRGTVPYAIAVIELDDAPGIRIVGNVVGCAVNDIEIDAPVEVSWDDEVGEGALPIPRWRLRTAA